MIPGNLENAYAYEIERRKDEMREAAKSHLVHQSLKRRKSPAWPMAILSILAWLLIIFIGR